MIKYYDVRSLDITLGRFTREQWATAFAVLLIKQGYEHVRVVINDGIVSNEIEFKIKMQKWSN